MDRHVWQLLQHKGELQACPLGLIDANSRQTVLRFDTVLLERSQGRTRVCIHMYLFVQKHKYVGKCLCFLLRAVCGVPYGSCASAEEKMICVCSKQSLPENYK